MTFVIKRIYNRKVRIHPIYFKQSKDRRSCTDKNNSTVSFYNVCTNAAKIQSERFILAYLGHALIAFPIVINWGLQLTHQPFSLAGHIYPIAPENMFFSLVYHATTALFYNTMFLSLCLLIGSWSLLPHLYYYYYVHHISLSPGHLSYPLLSVFLVVVFFHLFVLWCEVSNKTFWWQVNQDQCLKYSPWWGMRNSCR